MPCSVHGAGLDCNDCTTSNFWHVPLVLFTVGFGHPIFTLDGVRCFPHTNGAVLGNLGSSSWSGDSNSQSFSGSTTNSTQVSTQLGAARHWPWHSFLVLVYLLWRIGVAQQLFASAVLLPGRGRSPGIKTLLTWLLRCMWLCAFI